MKHISDSNLMISLNQQHYTLEKCAKKLNELKIQTLAALSEFDKLYTEYLLRFGSENAKKLTEFKQINNETLCAVLDSLAVVLDFSRKNVENIDVLADAVNNSRV